MDRITQLQDEIQQLLMIMSKTIAYLTSRSNFVQVSEEVPITKQRNPEKYDPPDVFEANQKELVTDLITKAKQIEYLINSLPEPEPEEEQAKRLQTLEDEMTIADEEYIHAVNRASQSIFISYRTGCRVGCTSRGSSFSDQGYSAHDACRHRRRSK